MCNYSDYIEDRGIAKGLEKGRKEGAELNLLNNLQSLMETMKWTANEAMTALKVPEADRPKYEAKLNK
jgi:predicted transposase YdaD